MEKINKSKDQVSKKHKKNKKQIGWFDVFACTTATCMYVYMCVCVRVFVSVGVQRKRVLCVRRGASDFVSRQVGG